jgi:hypothetical protein
VVRRIWSVIVATMAVVVIALSSSSVQAGVRVEVNLNTQRMKVTTPDGDVRHWAVSSGKTGYRTIRGTYRPYMLKTHHYSRKYGGAMPHAIFFKGGYAIHGTGAVSRLGSPASHGCIRLAPGNARELYSMVKRYGQRSTRIAIHGVAPDTGRTMVASAKKKQATTTVARVRSTPQSSFTVPAYAPQPLMVPRNSVPFQRLR